MLLISRTCSTLAYLVALLLAAWLAGCGGGGSGSAPSAASDAFTRTLTVTSAYTGVTYPVTIYLPAGYSTSSDAKPVVYAMDDELQGAVIVQAVRGFSLDAIVVTIGSLGSDRRFVDFDLPGATAYFRFLTLEIIPRVEAEYRADRTKRALMGYSLSGLAAMIALLEDLPSSRYFSGYVMTDPSLQFHTQDLYGMEQTLWDTTHSLPVRVYHCSTAYGSPSAELQGLIQSRGYQDLHYQFQVYQLNHATVLGPCVNDGLRWVFGLH